MRRKVKPRVLASTFPKKYWHSFNTFKFVAMYTMNLTVAVLAPTLEMQLFASADARAPSATSRDDARVTWVPAPVTWGFGANKRLGHVTFTHYMHVARLALTVEGAQLCEVEVLAGEDCC